ncbi:MAG: hypothetical protein JST20_11975 [Bacteroidetes bacterium]|nr:hypothetical protein [Bacteroidota bacterium]
MIHLILICCCFFTSIALGQLSTDSSVVKDSLSVQFKIKKVFLEYSPEIKKILKVKVGPVAKDILQNDVAMKFTFGGVYEFLPTPLKWIISKESFITHCMNNRYVLVEQLPDRTNVQKK